MRVSLNADPTDFVKQIADLRWFLNRQEANGAQAAMKARLMSGVLVPFLNDLRAELRADGFDPRDLLNAVAETIGNIVMSTVQSMLDAGEDVQRETAERIMAAAFDVVLMTIAANGRMARDAAERARPKLAVVPKDMEAGANVLPLNGKGK
jgi:hypothetical protein